MPWNMSAFKLPSFFWFFLQYLKEIRSKSVWFLDIIEYGVSHSQKKKQSLRHETGQSKKFMLNFNWRVRAVFNREIPRQRNIATNRWMFQNCIDIWTNFHVATYIDECNFKNCVKARVPWLLGNVRLYPKICVSKFTCV